MLYRETANQQIAALKHKVKTNQIKAPTIVEEAQVVAKTKTEEVIIVYYSYDQAKINSQEYLNEQQGGIDRGKSKIKNTITALKYAKQAFQLKDTMYKSAADQLLSYYWIKVRI